MKKGGPRRPRVLFPRPRIKKAAKPRAKRVTKPRTGKAAPSARVRPLVALGTREYVGGPNGVLLVHHEHTCPCRRSYRCTAPECAAQSYRECILCLVDRIELRLNLTRARDYGAGYP